MEKFLVIGGGPAGLTAAYELSRHGEKVSLFESHGSNSRDWTIIATIWLGHFGVFLTALFSPSDTYRVASSIATSTLFLTLVSVLAVAPSRLFGLQDRNSKVGANE
jgi:glycine/D-amino acid oxidase-like deaminating enzyme